MPMDKIVYLSSEPLYNLLIYKFYLLKYGAHLPPDLIKYIASILYWSNIIVLELTINVSSKCPSCGTNGYIPCGICGAKKCYVKECCLIVSNTNLCENHTRCPQCLNYNMVVDYHSNKGPVCMNCMINKPKSNVLRRKNPKIIVH